MKSLYFSASMALVLLGGCGSNNDTIAEDDTQVPVAITENQLALDQSLKGSAENIVVFNLEHPGAAPSEEDTATVGTDCYTYLHDETIQTVLSVENDNAIGSLFVVNKATNETISVLSGEVSIPLELSANNDYQVCVVHNGVLEEMQTVFVRFTDTENKSVASSAISSIDQQTVGYDPGDLQKLLATNECTYCELNNAYLGGANLHSANLSGANLTETVLKLANLTNANLHSANLTNADLGYADLGYANLTSSNLDGANMTSSKLGYADLSGANLTDADLAGATWTDDVTICKEGSIGECKK